MKITESIEIPESELHEIFIRSGGPGGQNLNKVSTSVQLRFDVVASESIPAHVKSRILMSNHNRINKDGELIIEASQFRTQMQNRDSAREKLAKIVQNALRQPRKRIKTNPSLRSRQARLDQKKRHSQKKSFRQRIDPD